MSALRRSLALLDDGVVYPRPVQMRVLILSFAFPPSQIIGAVRVGKTAKYLHRFGHEVRVIAGLRAPYPVGAIVEIPTENVSYTPWLDVDIPYQRTLSALQAARRVLRPKRHADRGNASLESTWQRLHGANNGAKSSRPLIERVRVAYQDVVHVPDSSIGWYRSALREARRIAREFKPDVIMASASPTTGLLVARQLSRETGVPWVGELRDLWADNHYNDTSKMRHSVDQWLERRTLRSASALITVSEPLAEVLRSKYNVPVSVVLNGFDTEDTERSSAATNGATNDGALKGAERNSRAPSLEVLHCGTVLAQRDPSALFDALKLMGENARDITVRFLGTVSAEMQDHLRRLAAARGVADRVQFAERVSHAEAVRIQRETDVLLLLTWNNPLERGVYTGKLFEYIGAGRPILSVGLSDGVAAELIRNRGFGFASDNPAAIAEQLSRWLEMKRKDGAIAAPNTSSVQEFTRETQTRRLEEVLLKAAASKTTQHVRG